MAVVDISDIEEELRGYVTTRLNEYYPEVDTTKNSIFDDIFISPFIKVLQPLVEKMSRLELSMNLMENAEFLTEEELNEIGENNYFMKRKQGKKASTILKLTFANLPLEEPYFELIIPSGITFTTSSGFEFQTIAQTNFTSSQLRTLYNSNKFCYEVYVTVYAKEIGSEYNVAAGEITNLGTYFSNFFVSCINMSDVINGSDMESNKDYAQRIKEFYLTRQLGTAPGYRAFILENFPEVTDVLVQGYQDEYMVRDIITVYDKQSKTTRDLHIGGKVDLYIRGCTYEDISEPIVSKSNDIVLNYTKADLADQDNLESNITIYDLTMPESNLTFTLDEVLEDGESKGKLIVRIADKRETDVKLAVSVNKNGSTYVDEIYKKIGSTQIEIRNVSSVNAVYDKAGNIIPNEKIEISISGEKDTTSEVDTIIIKDQEGYFNGDVFTVNYTKNKTLNDINYSINQSGNRIITADVIAKMATPVYINLQLTIKVSPMYKKYDSETIQNKLRSSISNFLSQYKMGDGVNGSDIISWLYTDQSVKDIITYINMPFDVFYIPKNPSDEISKELNVGDALKLKAFEYPLLNVSKFKVTLI